MSSRETSLWRWLSKAKPIYRKRLFMRRVENLVSSGFSDVIGCCDEVNFYIELKCEDYVDDKEIHVRFEPGQIEFMEELIDAGGNYYVLLNAKNLVSGKETKLLISGTEGKILTGPISISRLIRTPGYVVTSPKDAIEHMRSLM